MQVKFNEIGRSMVEILGVLTVTGVLSIGGIMGYRYAMDRYRANDIIHEVNIRGQDIWNHYQGIELPESIDEWNDTTTTGYPIGIETVPADNLFSINVDNVSPRVCKLVLSGQYKSVHAMVIDGETGIIYDGNLEICGTNDSENKTMLFSFDTLSGFGEGHGLCITDSDCGDGCFYCGENHLCQTTCIGSKSVCSSTKQTCVECETNEHCLEGKVCNDIENICETVNTKKCEEGYFRSKNGICIECSYAGNIIIDPEETFGEDEVTGTQSCAACSGVDQPRIVEGDTTNTYCSKTCTPKISWPSTTNGCIPCNDNSFHVINKDDQDSVDQCLACPGNYLWLASQGRWMCGKMICDEGKYYRVTWGDPICSACSTNEATGLGYFSNAEVQAKAEAMCNNCPSSTPRQVIDGSCWPICSQPDEAESITICKANPEDINCKRQFQQLADPKDDMHAAGKCLSCSVEKSYYVGTDSNSVYYQMCLNCGRKVSSDGYCYLDKVCKSGQFKGKDGSCHECTEGSRVEIESEEASKCLANCMKDSTGNFVANGTIAGRFIDNGYCYKDCGEGYFNSGGGSCVACSNDSSGHGMFIWGEVSTKLKQLCTSCAAPNERILINDNFNEVSGTEKEHAYCTLKKCPNGFHIYRGGCASCTASGYGNVDKAQWGASEKDCIACGGNRMMIGNDCVLVDPGQSAICNHVGNTLPSYLSTEAKNAAETYIRTYKENIKNPNFSDKKFRNNDGICYSCDEPSQISVGNTDDGKEQCKSCGNRRFANGQCIYGLCSESNSFLQASDGACVACGTGGKKVEILTSSASQNLCASCTGHRAMTIGTIDLDNLKAYCIESCTDFEFSDINANCYDEDSTIEKIEIGTDEKSISDCNNIDNRTVITDQETGKVYCQLL
ncbi:MAG: hypothetical protein E7014_06760 [Alphaproteobacteria bacterium]|nr:hypothetical protein [Alphaproteobacteria bacterium]